jgi:hypothetical protein
VLTRSSLGARCSVAERARCRATPVHDGASTSQGAKSAVSVPVRAVARLQQLMLTVQSEQEVRRAARMLCHASALEDARQLRDGENCHGV